MAIKGATFDLQTVLAKYDGAMYNALSNNHDGYVSWTGSGNPITFTDTNVLTLKNGYILVHGRLIVVDGATDITLNPGSSISSGDGRLVLQIDTSRTNTQTVLNQVEILQEYKATGSSWRTLSIDDINALSTGVYEVQLCHFAVSNGTSSGVQIDISTDTLIGNLQADIETLADSVEQTGDAVGTLQTSKANAGLSTPSASDMNNITTAGWYYITATQTTNKPSGTNYGILEVIRTSANTGGLIAQRFITTAGVVWSRVYVNSAWTSWKKEVSSVVPITDGGTGLTSSPSMLTNLASNTATSVLQATPRPGVTGVLQVENGGTGLTSSPSMLTNLASSAAAGIMQATPRPGVTGTLPIANGGTGLTSNPSMLTNLASSTAASVLQTTPRPGVTGILPIGNGGTGASTADSARANLEAMQQVEYEPGVAFSFEAVQQMYANTPNRDCIIRASFTSGRKLAIKMFSSANYGVLVVFGFGSPSFTIYRLVNQVWYEEYQGRDIVKVTYTNEALTGLNAKQLKVASSTLLNGVAFGTLTANRTYITLPAGTYKINTNFRANPGANGFIKTCLKIGNTSTLFIITDQFYAGAGCGTNASIIGVNATDVITLTASTNIYFLVMSQNNTDGCEGSLTIEKLA